jgi:WD40 repeat protein
MAIATNPTNHNHLCVANGGSNNTVACFNLNSKGLQPIKNSLRPLFLNQTTPPTGPAGTVSDVLFSEDGKQLLVSIKGSPPVPGLVAQFDVAKDGSLSKDFNTLTASAGGLVR